MSEKIDEFCRNNRQKMSEKIDEFCRNNHQKLQEPIMQNFLKDKSNQILFQNAITQPTSININKLNEAFAMFYKKVKIINYISKLIHFYSIDFDKKINLNKKREVLNLDSPLSGFSEEGISKKDVIPSSEKDIALFVSNDFTQTLSECIENEKLFKALEFLSEKQVQVLNLIYKCNLTNKETAQILKSSEQTISYNHKTALKKLRELMETLH